MLLRQPSTLTNLYHLRNHRRKTTTNPVVATLLPLAGLGRRLPFANLLQLTVLSQAACYSLAACPSAYAGSLGGGGAAAAWQLLPEGGLAIG